MLDSTRSLFVASSCCNVCKIFAITLYQFRAKFLLVLKEEERHRGREKWDAHYCWHYFGRNGIRSVRSASSFWCRKVFLQALIVINIMCIHFRCPYLWHFQGSSPTPPPPTHTHTPIASPLWLTKLQSKFFAGVCVCVCAEDVMRSLLSNLCPVCAVQECIELC